MPMMDNPSGPKKKKPTKALRAAQARAKKLSNEAKRKSKSLKALQKRVNEAAKRAKKLAGKKPTSKKGAAQPKKTSASRTSRGMYAQYLPTLPRTYGSNLPDWAKELGYTGSTVPIVSLPTTPRMGFDGKGTGFVMYDKNGNPVLDKDGNPKYEPIPAWQRTYSMELFGQPASEAPKKKATKKSAKAQFTEILGRAAEAKGKWLSLVAAGADQAKQDAAKKRYEDLEARVVEKELTTLLYQEALKGKSTNAILKSARAAARAKMAGGTPPAAVQAGVQAAASAPPTPQAVQQAAQAAAPTGGPPGAKWTMQRGPGGRFVKRQVTPNGNYYDDLDMNPMVMAAPETVYAYSPAVGKDGRRKGFELLMSEAVPDKNGRLPADAVTVVVSPTVQYAVLTKVKEVQKAVKKNGSDFLESNMAKRGMKRNPLGSDLMELGRPVLGATAGFAASRAVNALALYGLSKTQMDLSSAGAQIGIRAAATAVGVLGTMTLGNKVDMIRDNRTSIVTGMILNVAEVAVRALTSEKLAAPDANPYLRNLALGASYYDMSHAGAPYSPMMGEYVSQSLNGMGEYVSQSLNGGMGSYIAQAAAGMGEYVSQSLNGGDGLGEYVSQSLNGLGEYAEGVDPSDQEGVDSMINSAEAVAGLSGTEVMAATAGLGATEVMAATAGLGNVQGMNRGIVTRRGIYNFFTQPVSASGGRLPTVSIEDAPMPVVGMGPARPGAVPIDDQVATPEGRGYAGGIFGRHIFGTMV